MTVRSVLGLFGIRPWEIGLTYDDLLEEGRIGMWKSIAKYDPESGANFLTYAKPAIRHAVIDFIREQRKDVEALSDRIAILQNGRLRALGTLSEIEEQAGEKGLENAFVKIAGEEDAR